MLSDYHYGWDVITHVLICVLLEKEVPEIDHLCSHMQLEFYIHGEAFY